MIKNSDLLYEKAKAYQDERNRLEDKYSADIESLREYEGSEYYEEQTEKLTKEYEENMSVLKANIRTSFNVIIKGMKDVIGRTPATAPTEEQLRLLEVLKMRNKITKEDLDTTATALKGCPLGLKALSEIALDKGFMGYERYITEMTTEEALNLFNSSWIKDFIEYNEPRAARIVSQQNKLLYGDAAMVSTVRRKPFTDKEGFYRLILGLNGERLQNFCNLADRESIA